jgi:hypothetical protein
MPTPTYTPLATVTLGSAVSSVSFASIPASYRDLIVVFAGTRTGTNNILFRFNSDTGSNYNWIVANGNGSTTVSVAETVSSIPTGYYNIATDAQMNVIFQVMDYSATDKHKTALSRSSQGGAGVAMVGGRWANTAAITTIQVLTGDANFGSGSTFSLYGVIA